MENKRNTFGGNIGFVLAAAGSAVGLGNIWRFPYLAAKDGGGLFLVVYIALALTFGFTLLTAEIAIGRKSRQGPLTAHKSLKKGWGIIGVISCVVPMIILPYYCAIGGWVLKYFVAFLTGDAAAAATDGYFTDFITTVDTPIIYMLVFFLATAVVILLGVNKGIESLSKVFMPILLLLVIGISVFLLTVKNTDADGTVRTGLQGFRIFVIPSLDGITFKDFLNVVVDAMGQLFFSLSVAMGIMIAYGSYVSDDTSLSKSINQIEFFDTLIAFLAGVMIIPAVYVFMGREGLSASGPSLMFISLPKVFAIMGKAGTVIGCLFFLMVFIAALTSSISIFEAIVSSFMDGFGMTRKKAVLTEGAIALVCAVAVCLGYNKFYFELTLPTGSTGQILDILDYISNNLLMPVGAILTCIFVGWVIKPQAIIDEIEKDGNKMGRKRLFSVMIKYIAPVLLFILLLKSTGIIG